MFNRILEKNLSTPVSVATGMRWNWWHLLITHLLRTKDALPSELCQCRFPRKSMTLLFPLKDKHVRTRFFCVFAAARFKQDIISGEQHEKSVKGTIDLLNFWDRTSIIYGLLSAPCEICIPHLPVKCKGGTWIADLALPWSRKLI